MKEKKDREKIMRIVCENWETGPVSILAQTLGIHRTTLTKMAKELGLRIAEPKEAKHIDLTQELREVFDGLLLGGGALVPGAESAFFVVGSQQPKYLKWISVLLQKHKIEMEGKGIYPFGANSWRLITRSYYELYSFYQRWYPKGVKDVPLDLKLTPKILFLWFLKGGHIEITGGRKQKAVRFWVLRYSKEGRRHLLKELQRLSFRPSLYESRRIAMIRIGANDLSSFYSYIGPCPEELEEVFGEKWLWALPG